MEDDSMADNKSITCLKLPEVFILDKQETKKFFGQFGAIKSFILKPSKAECIIEYETVEAAQMALNSNAGFDIIPTKAEHLKVNEEFIDPDVQSEIQAMLPTGLKTSKQSMETLIKHPFKSKMYPAPKQKTEPLTVFIQSDPRLIQNVKSELESLIRKPAFSADEKFAILDVRDKLYRLMNTKSTDLKNVTSTKGTCKDMCPEKERFMRLTRCQVAAFEKDVNSDEPNSMDFKRAIKEYSRSSADQEIPLPHELRSEQALKATMTYLLHEIINLCEHEDVSIGDWYHFVWDRTRSIRKDITQQELCSLNTVELLEQCARFHIHCSARLIAEDPADFDQKINDENLTKSLQTLKYMYDDLKLKNIKCPNEAEFRAYVVLLNLNESGNFLWEIKRLEKDLLHSPEMKFALDVYFAVALNNYVRFFGLVREARYMNACILLKYFTQIRLKAIFTIMRAYTQRRGFKFTFNLSYLTEILNFENYEQTASFMTYYGGSCDLDGDTVSLEPSSFANISTPYQMERALDTVEYKLDGTVAEAIYGDDLPSPDCFLRIEPHSSFDAGGCLKKDAFYVEDQNGPAVNKDNVFKVPRESPPVSPGLKVYQQKNIFSKSDSTDGLFGSVPFSSTKTSTPFHHDSPFSVPVFGSGSIFGSFANTPNTNQKISSIFGQPRNSFDSVKSSPVSDTVKAPTINVLAFARPTGMPESPQSKLSSSFDSNSSSSQCLTSDQDAAIEQERVRLENEAAELLLRKKLAEKEQERRESHEREKKEAERRRVEAETLKEKNLQKNAEKILNLLFDEIVAEKVTMEVNMADIIYVQIPKDFYAALEYDVVVEQLIKIFEIEQLSYINRHKRMYETMFVTFDHWRKMAVKERQRRDKLSNIGCTALNRSIEEHASAILHPQQAVALANMRQYLSGSSQSIIVPDLDAFESIDLFEDLKMPQNLPSKLFWKIVVSIPLKSEEKAIGFSSYIRKWLSRVFGVPDNQDVFKLHEKVVQHSKMSICLRKIQGIDCADEKMEKQSSAIDNTNGLVFFCTAMSLGESRRRLNNILDKIDSSIAVLVIIYKNVVEDSDEQTIRTFFDLSMEPKVNNFEISLFYECKEKIKDLRQVVIDGCQFLFDNYVQQLNTEYSRLYDLEMQHILDFFQCYFGDEMWQRIEYSCRDNIEFGSRMTSFNNVIEVFNACLHKMIGILSMDCRKLPTLPDEFRSKLPSLEVRIPNSFEYFPANWNRLIQQRLIKLLSDLKLSKMPNDKFENFKDFQHKIQLFLDVNMSAHFKTQVFHTIVNKVVEHFYLMQLRTSDKIDNAIDRMRWLRIFECIVVGKFNEVYQLKEMDLPKFVIYSRKDVASYMIPWWFAAKLDFEAAGQNGPAQKKAKLVGSVDMKDFEEIVKKGRDSLAKATGIIRNSRENTTKTRQDSKEFDELLSKCEDNFRGIKRTLKTKYKE